MIRGNAFVAGSSTENQITRVPYSKIVFDYKLEGAGTMDIRLRASVYSNYYGQFTFKQNGESTDYAGVTTEKLSDGYIRVTINIAELTPHTSTEPEDTANIQIYKTTTVGGYLEIIELIEA